MSISGENDVEVPCSPVRGAPQANTSAYPTALHSLRMECGKYEKKSDVHISKKGY